MSRKVVLLMPGLMNPASLWNDVRQLIDSSVEIKIADFTTQESLDEMAASAWEAIADASDAEVVLCGFSMGSYVALEMLAKPRFSLKAALLIGSSIRPETEQAHLMREKSIGFIERDFKAFVDRLVPFLVADGFLKNTEIIEQLKSSMLSVGKEAAIRQNRAISKRSLNHKALASCKTPVALMCGLEDKVNSFEKTQEIAQVLNVQSVSLLRGVGHMVVVEDPKSIADCIKSLFE